MSMPQQLGDREFVLRSQVKDRIESIVSRIHSRELRDVICSALEGGKRIRPLITCLACEAAGGRAEAALEVGIAIEMLHCSSCIHDDIMDQSPLRRGKPTVHVAHGISMAILAGDTLSALAFRAVLSQRSPRTPRMLQILSDAFIDLCDGQACDLRSNAGVPISAAEHHRMVENKTARLLEAACAIGGLVATANEMRIHALAEFGLHLGLAFQAQDDLLDMTGTEDTLGKPVGLDQKNGKQTYLTLAYPEVDPLERTRELVRSHTLVGLEALQNLPESEAREALHALALSLIDRRM